MADAPAFLRGGFRPFFFGGAAFAIANGLDHLAAADLIEDDGLGWRRPSNR